MKFPDIPGVEFKKIDIGTFENYAMSSDKKVWIGKRGSWRKMKVFTCYTGKDGVKLQNPDGGFKIFDIDELYQKVFKDECDTTHRHS